jgi:histidinol-phosphate aminotransferase
LKRVWDEGGLLFVCSPNNPTGTQFEKGEVLEAVASFKGLVVLDEAYVEFARYSLSKRITEFRNLAVLRTFSKAYGMAGLRLAYILANDSWAPEFLGRVQYPYPINSVAAATAVALMRRYSSVNRWTESVKKERSWLSGQLRELPGVRVAPSEANFLLVSVPVDSARVHSALLRRGVATREVGAVPGMSNCLRITVGTRAMNSRLLKTMREVVPSAG